MDAPNNSPNQEAKPAERSATLGLFLRLFWMFLGNMALGMSAIKIIGNHVTWFSLADVVYGTTIPLLIGARYVDIARYQGATATGEPATIKHWIRYTVSLTLISATVWVASHAVAYFFAR